MPFINKNERSRHVPQKSCRPFPNISVDNVIARACDNKIAPFATVQYVVETATNHPIIAGAAIDEIPLYSKRRAAVTLRDRRCDFDFLARIDLIIPRSCMDDLSTELTIYDTSAAALN